MLLFGGNNRQFDSIEEIEEIRKERDNLRKTAKIRLASLQDERRKNAALRAENEALREDLNEYREILCNKQKQLDLLTADDDALRKQVEQMRGYIESLERDMGKGNMKKKTISLAQRYVLDTWNEEHPEMAMKPWEFMGILEEEYGN